MLMSKLAQDIFSRLNRHDFATFTFEALRMEYTDLEKVEVAPDVYSRAARFNVPFPNSYSTAEATLYINHFSPVELFEQPTPILDESWVSDTLGKIKAAHFREPGGYLTEMYVLLNTAEPESEIWDFASIVAPQFKKLIDQAGFTSVDTYGVGTFSSFMSSHPEETTQALAQLIQQPSDGLAITIHGDKPEVRHFWSEKPLFCGVASDSLSPYEPVYVSVKRHHTSILEEFEALLSPETAEEELERFLIAHYKDILGPAYDQIEAQLWLRFPELDIAGSERRLDVFVRHSVKRDWELFELKKAVPKINKRGEQPKFISKVHDAIEQLRNYGDLLGQIAVKDRLAKEGIKYFEPSLNLVIGRRPQISDEQWRRLLSHNSDRVKIFTWDDLVEETKVRLQDRENVFKFATPMSVTKRLST